MLGNDVPRGLLNRLVRNVEREGKALSREGNEIVLVHLADRAVVTKRPDKFVDVGHAHVVVRIKTQVIPRLLIAGNDLSVTGDGKRIHRTGELNLESASCERVGGGDVSV